MQRRHFLILATGGLTTLGLSACGGGGGTAVASRNVLGIADANGAARFARAASGTELAAVLAGPGPYTVFAPTDRAFAAAGRLDAGELTRLLAYHVVPGELTLGFLDGRDVNHTTLLGSSLNVDGTDGLSVNGARIVRADLVAANGVVHVIDQLLDPR